VTLPLVVGNWKMHGSQSECADLARQIARAVTSDPEQVQVAVAPPFTALAVVKHTLEKTSIRLCGQNCHWEERGAFTGEISAAMLRDVGCDFVIIGHSERRHIFNESDELVAQKLGAVLSHGLRAIVCVGETLDERQREQTTTVIARQLGIALKGLGKDAIANLEIAYEPVWAIGTGQNATPTQVSQVHKRIRQSLVKSAGSALGSGVRILYGGSVKPENSLELAQTPEVGGFLVGGASLQADSFLTIVRSFSSK
jgi:triosephosphate isomerase